MTSRLLHDRRGVTAMEYTLVTAAVVGATLMVAPLLADMIATMVARLIASMG